MSNAGVFSARGFRSFWLADTVSEFGTYVTTLALQVLVVTTLHGTAFDVGLINGSRWIAYLALGLVIGALMERRRRKPVLVTADFARAILLGLIPLFWALGWLTVPLLMVFVAVFGFFSLVGDSASQSFLPRLVARENLVAANARIDQSSAVAQTSGPLLAGGLVGLVGAPLAVLFDAVSYLFSAIVIARIRVIEPPPSAAPRNLRREIAEGFRWVYAHRMLRPIALTTHLWFVFNAMLGTVFVSYAITGNHLTAFEFGICLAGAGVGGLVGSLFSMRLGMRWGAGPVVIACNTLMVAGWAVIALAQGSTVTIVILLTVGQFIFGVALGASNANEMGYRQAITPDEFQGRTNTTMRSFNRAAIIIGAPLGGLLAGAIGYRPTLWIAIAGFALISVLMLVSPLRHARHGVVPEP